MDKGWKLEDLAREAGVAPRTVRYYVQRGLLTAPVFRGKDTVYSNEHLVRLRAIRHLQERFLPLDVIQVELERRSLAELERIADEPAPPPPAPEPEMVFLNPPADEKWVRVVLAPGLEMHLSERADKATRKLADELRKQLTQQDEKGNK